MVEKTAECNIRALHSHERRLEKMGDGGERGECVFDKLRGRERRVVAAVGPIEAVVRSAAAVILIVAEARGVRAVWIGIAIRTAVPTASIAAMIASAIIGRIGRCDAGSV